MTSWEDLDEVLAPWRVLGRKSPSRSLLADLRARLLDQVGERDPLVDPGDVVTVAGDWHGEAAWAVLGVGSAAKAGARVLLHVGDFEFWHGDRGEGYLDAIEMACIRSGVDVVWIDGNHEDHRLLPRFPLAPCGLRPVRPHVWHIPRGHRWTWHGKRWVGVGGAVSVDRAIRQEGFSWWPEEALTPDQAAAIAAAGPADVMVTHDRPAMAAAAVGHTPGSWHASAPQSWDRADLVAADEHSALLQTVVNAVRPERLFHGHLHHRYDLVVDPAPWGGPCRVTGLSNEGTPGNLLHVATATPTGA